MFKVFESAVIGRRAKAIMRRAAVWALIITAPKVLTEDCKITLPIDTIELINPIAKPCSKRSEYKSLVPFEMLKTEAKVLARSYGYNKSIKPLIILVR